MYAKWLSYMTKHRNLPIFTTESRNIQYISDFVKQNYCQTRKSYVFKDAIRQTFNPTDTDVG